MYLVDSFVVYSSKTVNQTYCLRLAATRYDAHGLADRQPNCMHTNIAYCLFKKYLKVSSFEL